MSTKEEWQECLLSILEPLKAKFSADSARIVLDGGGTTYPQRVIELEAFARPLWGLVPFWYGGGHEPFFEKQYLEGLIAGPDPQSPGFWGDCSDYDQRFVEMAPIAFGLMAVPDILWNPLPEDAKDRLASWLYQINDHEMSRCNWYFFRIIVNTALKAIGKPYSQPRLESDSAFIESCYIGNGWYKDGVSGRTDYYSAFAMHYYPLLLAAFADREWDTTKARASLFADDFIYWFAETGEAIPYGRSLTYRFAQSAFWSAFAFLADDPKIGICKGIIEKNIRYWLGKDIFDSNILSVGYGYPNLTMAERYNAPGSPYWSLKAFLFLALPDNHTFWKAESLPLPHLQPLKNELGRRLIQHRGWDVTMYEPGMLGMRSLGHFTEKYDKFAYSSSSPFSVSHSNESIEEAAADSMLAFVVDGTVYVRKGSVDFFIENDSLVSHWSPCPEIDVETRVIIKEDGHLRTHIIRSSMECSAYDSGFSREKDNIRKTETCAEVSSSGIHSSAECVEGNGVPVVLNADPNTNLMWRNSVIPSVEYHIGNGETRISTRFRLWKN